jgi:hypothetical protein
VSWQQIQPFLVALAIGLLLGLERERSHSRKLPAGSRSFALLSLVGAVTASFGEWAVVVGLVGVGTLLAFAYFRTSQDDPGITTAIAALVAYLLGALAYARAAVAVALAVVVASLLVSKTRIHRFAREIVSEVELEDAIKFFVVAFVTLPLLPNRALGPYGVLNPAKVWLLVVLLTGIGWVGYIGVRALGPNAACWSPAWPAGSSRQPRRQRRWAGSAGPPPACARRSPAHSSPASPPTCSYSS